MSYFACFTFILRFDLVYRQHVYFGIAFRYRHFCIELNLNYGPQSAGKVRVHSKVSEWVGATYGHTWGYVYFLAAI